MPFIQIGEEEKMEIVHNVFFGKAPIYERGEGKFCLMHPSGSKNRLKLTALVGVAGFCFPACVRTD